MIYSAALIGGPMDGQLVAIRDKNAYRVEVVRLETRDLGSDFYHHEDASQQGPSEPLILNQEFGEYLRLGGEPDETNHIKPFFWQGWGVRTFPSNFNNR